MKMADLAAVRESRDLINDAIVACLHFVRIFDDLINKVAKMQHEPKLVLRARAFVLKDHSPVRVELALVDVLTADEREIDRPRIARRRCGDGPADAASIPVRIRESVPVSTRRFEMANQ